MTIPSGNIDIAPTILWILGVEPKQRPSGRVLKEAPARDGQHSTGREAHLLEASYSAGGLAWRQYLKYSEVNGVRYFDEGNGEQVSRSTHRGQLMGSSRDALGPCLPFRIPHR